MSSIDWTHFAIKLVKARSGINKKKLPIQVSNLGPPKDVFQDGNRTHDPGETGRCANHYTTGKKEDTTNCTNREVTV